MKSYAIGALIVALAVMNVLLCVEVYRLRSALLPVLADADLYIGHPVIPDVMVSDCNGERFTLLEVIGGKAPMMLVFFSSSDCPNCFSEKSLWAEVASATSTKVMGVAVSASSREFREWAAELDIAIPLYVDTTFAIFDSMEFVVTPLKVLVSSNGQVLWADPPRLDKTSRLSFWRDFNHAIKEYY